MDPNFTNENDPWEYNLDIDDFDLNLTPVVRSSSSTCFKQSSSTPNPVRIIPGLAGLVQRAKQLKENVFILDPDGALMSTQEYMQKVVEDVGENSDFNSGAWISATNYVLSTGGTVTGCLGDINNFLEKGKLKQVVAIVKSCSPNCLGDLNVTMKDLSGIGRGTVNHKVQYSCRSCYESSYPTIEESVEEHEYLTEGGLTEDKLHQLAKDVEAGTQRSVRRRSEEGKRKCNL
ncbi:hypothetical protein Tco_1411812 [Tanacetum coccineum]